MLKFNQNTFQEEYTSVWSFENRGNWSNHTNTYRGNWSPQVVRNLIHKYSRENEYLLDPMIGGGTTAIECKLLNRNLLALDINPIAIKLTKKSINFKCMFEPKIKTLINDSRNLKMLKNECIDFILIHPPYTDIIKYSNNKILQDLSNIHDIEKFCYEIEIVAKELFRVLKKGKYCAVLMGDTRRKGFYQPLA